jgi:hypothetical protein
MRGSITVLLPFVVCAMASAQSYHFLDICGLPPSGYIPPNGSPDCHFIDTSVMGGIRFEDYKITNPAAVQFDPAQRVKELAAMGPAIAATMSAAPPAFTTPTPTIAFNNSSVQAQIYYRPQAGSAGSDMEFMDVQFSNFTASNGYTSPNFGFRMVRQFTATESEVPQFQIQIQAGNPGLTGVAGIPVAIGFVIDPVGKSASFIGTMPSSAQLRQAILGVFVNAQSILNAAKFTITNPAPAGVSFWTPAEITSLAGQAAPWILAAVDPIVPVGPPHNCVLFASGYTACTDTSEMNAFSDMLLKQGGEYLGLRTQQSFNVLVGNLLSWARAKAPSIDPAYAANGGTLKVDPVVKTIFRPQ